MMLESSPKYHSEANIKRSIEPHMPVMTFMVNQAPT